MKRAIALLAAMLFLGGAMYLYAAATGEKITTIHGTAPYLDVYDEDTMTSNAERGIPTQQSVKAYVDAKVQLSTVNLTNAQIKDLADTPVDLVAAPGAGYVLEFLHATLILNYGSNALTEPSTPDDLVIQYGSGTDVSASIVASGFITATADTIAVSIPVSVAGTASASISNDELELFNTGGDYTGNAGADTTMTVITAYRIHATGL